MLIQIICTDEELAKNKVVAKYLENLGKVISKPVEKSLLHFMTYGFVSTKDIEKIIQDKTL